MKKYILTIILTTIISLSYSQSLSNTSWIAFDTTNSAGLYFYFGTDTLCSSTDNILYTPLSVYSQTGSLFSISDINSLFCVIGVTGNYNLIQGNDSLNFSLISDTCTARSDYLIYHNFVRIYTSVKTVDVLTHPVAFPNPFNENLKFIIEENNPVELTLYDICMHKIINISFTNSISLNMDQLKPGIYFYTIKNGDEPEVRGKVLKQ